MNNASSADLTSLVTAVKHLTVTDSSLGPIVDHSRIAIIVPNANRREEIQKMLDPQRERFHVIAANQIIAGFRFNAVLITEETKRIVTYKGRTAIAKFDAWIGTVQQRCTNNTQIVTL